ncbi:PREDICTED: serpin B6-like [Priapulus caudatus]|uniref:Serpin B6-like n=1 Tax=Priapulus caudatus TaxID=37621 RepID=A0ABM1F8X2_PRICU|nr:PREDICTED: serpin B6-like [Priapulus caudatus]XP_014680892.1 PREDICTED: serpin B6-like [Priapulus caudatus]XP_014680893.1 PREDICTED: serpin B6-like [Priapulus caudatus]
MAEQTDTHLSPQPNGKFTINFFETVKDGKDGENIFFSPVSIHLSLAMTMLGALGNTAQQLKTALQLLEMDSGDLHEEFCKMLDVVRSAREGSSLHIANRHFVQNDYKLLKTFQDASQKFYKADAKNVDFASNTEASRLEINKWVGEETQNWITDLLPSGSLSSLTRLVLVNACYFKGDWKSKFNVQLTKPEVFHVSSTRKENVLMMKQRGKFNLGFHAMHSFWFLELPYLNEDLSMFLVVPTEIEGLQKFEKNIDMDLLNQMEKQLIMENSVFVCLPQFRIRMNVDLVKTLQKMGVTDLFSEKSCDLKGICEDDLHVASAVHESFMLVDEEGTEAAAATAVVMNLRCAPRPPMEVKVDRPFIFYIKDKKSGQILFFGRYNKPMEHLAVCC